MAWMDSAGALEGVRRAGGTPGTSGGIPDKRSGGVNGSRKACRGGTSGFQKARGDASGL